MTAIKKYPKLHKTKPHDKIKLQAIIGTVLQAGYDRIDVALKAPPSLAIRKPPLGGIFMKTINFVGKFWPTFL